jgi:hypothetical protein
LFHEERRTERQTDITNLLLAFQKSSKAPEKFIHMSNYMLRSTLMAHLQICHRVTLHFVSQFVVSEPVPDQKTFHEIDRNKYSLVRSYINYICAQESSFI